MKSFRKFTIFTLVLTLFYFFLSACAPSFRVTDCERYVFYSNVQYGEYARNYLDLCLPKNKSGNVGLILMIHGGGWIAGDKDCYTESIKQYSAQGYVCSSINYRYANGTNVTADDILDDITMALLKIKNVAQDHNISVNKMLLTGGSAGAHLALLYAYSKQEFSPITPVAVVSFCGPTDFTDTSFYENGADVTRMVSKITGVDMTKKNIQSVEPFLKQASPISYVKSSTVPTILCHGEKDSVVPYSNATRLVDKLTTCHVEHEFVSFPNSNHGLESDNDCFEYANTLMQNYCSTYLN